MFQVHRCHLCGEHDFACYCCICGELSCRQCHEVKLVNAIFQSSPLPLNEERKEEEEEEEKEEKEEEDYEKYLKERGCDYGCQKHHSVCCYCQGEDVKDKTLIDFLVNLTSFKNKREAKRAYMKRMRQDGGGYNDEVRTPSVITTTTTHH